MATLFSRDIVAHPKRNKFIIEISYSKQPFAFFKCLTNMKRIILLISGFLICYLSVCQTWEKRFDFDSVADGAICFEEISDYWYVIGGKSTEAPNYRYWSSIEVLDGSSGNLIQSKDINQGISLYEIQSIGDSLFCISGTKNKKGYLAVYDLQLNLIWEDSLDLIGDSSSFAISKLTINNSKIYGRSCTTDSNLISWVNVFCWDIKTGSFLWENKIEGHQMYFGDIKVFNDTIFTLNQPNWDPNSTNDENTYLTKWDTNGNIISNDTLFEFGQIYSLDLYKDHYYLTGFELLNPGVNSSTHGIVLKMDKEYNIIWKIGFKGNDSLSFDSTHILAEFNHGNDLEVKDDKIVICGTTDRSINSWGETFYGILDTSGNIIYSYSFVGDYKSFSFDIDILDNNSIGLVGFMEKRIDSLYFGYYHVVKMDDTGYFDSYKKPNLIQKSQSLKKLTTIYPNPFINNINLELSSNQKTKFQLLTPSGAVVKTFILNKRNKIDLSDLDRGIYIYRISSLNKIETGKIIKH